MAICSMKQHEKSKIVNIKQKYRKLRRNFFESMGDDRYSRPSLFEMDRKLEKYLTNEKGVFIEVGANDGYSQSNTYYFEKFRGWTGILIEGIPELYNKCILERSKSQVFNCALVAEDFQEPYVTMKYAHLMSIVDGVFDDNVARKEYFQNASQHHEFELNSYEVKVPTRTLTSILDECKIDRIDFFSLDVEGAELQVLKGLDLNKYRPKYMLIETTKKDEVEKYISNLYACIEQFSYHDYLYKCMS
jgi:FkbM family methyltransferase